MEVFEQTSQTVLHPRRPEAVFAHVLVTGASVSAGYASVSPGKLLGQRFGGSNSVNTVAESGRTGRELIRRLSSISLQGRSCLIAIDFLFWDSVFATVPESLRALDALKKLARDARIPLVLGDIPELLPAFQHAAAALNLALAASHRPDQDCFVLGLARWYQHGQSEGLKIGEKHYPLMELLPDGLHIGQRASEFLADEILHLVCPPEQR